MAVFPTLLALCLAAGSVDDDSSLESFLARARSERDAFQAHFHQTVDRLIERLQADRAPGPLSLGEIRDELDALGPEAAPILLPWIDPGKTPTDSTKLRASEIEDAILRERPAGIVGELIRGTQTLSPDGRLAAIRLLGFVPETERAGAHLSELFGASSGEARLACIVALASLETDRYNLVLRKALTDDDPSVVRSVLRALARSQNFSAVPAVLNLTRSSAAAAPVAGEIVAFWLACADQVDEETITALIRLTMHTATETKACVAILDALPEFSAVKSKNIKRKLAPTLQSSNPLVKEAALVCVTVLGDRTSRRELLEPFDTTIDENKLWFKGYMQRAEILMRIHDYSDAAKDLKDGLELLGKRAHQSTYNDAWIDLALCYVSSKKLAKAAGTLEDMGMTSTVKARLRDDPDFAPLVEHSRYGKLFD